MQATPLVAGLAVGAAAYAGKLAIEMAMKMRAAPRLRNFYKVRRASRGFVCVVCLLTQLYAAVQHCASSLLKSHLTCQGRRLISQGLFEAQTPGTDL